MALWVLRCIWASGITMLWDLTFPMLRLLSSKAQGCKDLWKPSQPCHVGIHWIALAEYSQMRSMYQGFNLFSVFFFFFFLHHFVLAKLATSSIRVNPFMPVATKNILAILVISLWLGCSMKKIWRRNVAQNQTFNSHSNISWIWATFVKDIAGHQN